MRVSLERIAGSWDEPGVPLEDLQYLVDDNFRELGRSMVNERENHVGILHGRCSTNQIPNKRTVCSWAWGHETHRLFQSIIGPPASISDLTLDPDAHPNAYVQGHWLDQSEPRRSPRLSHKPSVTMAHLPTLTPFQPAPKIGKYMALTLNGGPPQDPQESLFSGWAM